MAEDLTIIQGSKAEIYQSLIPQIKALLDGEPDLVANLANVSAALKEQFNWLWVGFYLIKPDLKNDAETELVLGPFQGPVACTRIKKRQRRLRCRLAKCSYHNCCRCRKISGAYSL